MNGGARAAVGRGTARAAVGRYGEDVAARHLAASGLQVLERNWRSPARDAGGEVDIVARDGDVLVICEVKTRRGTAFGTPLEAVTPRKAARIRRLARTWLSTHGGGFSAVRFDVVAVICPPSGAAIVEHVRGAF